MAGMSLLVVDTSVALEALPLRTPALPHAEASAPVLPHTSRSHLATRIDQLVDGGHQQQRQRRRDREPEDHPRASRVAS